MNKEIQYSYDKNKPIAGFDHLLGHMLLKGQMTIEETLEVMQDQDERYLGERPPLPPDFSR